MEACRCDAVSDIARRYPVPIICELLGTRREDWDLLSAWADDIFKVFDWNVVEDGPVILRAWRALEAYLEDMVESRRDSLTDDLLSDMMRAEIEGDRPDQWELLARHPELAPSAVEEVMRYSPVVFGTLRVAVEDVELAGCLVPEGTLVIANIASANRDPRVYAEAERFDITRQSAPAMLTFGGGVHYCLGAHLARIELAEALTLMAQRMPDIRRDGPSSWRTLTGITGPAKLPIRFGKGAGQGSANGFRSRTP